MKTPNISSKKINFLFYIGLAAKGLNGLFECIGAYFLFILKQEWIDKFMTSVVIPELRQDPSDKIMNYFYNLGHTLSIDSQRSVAVYMMLHGAIKLIFICLLFKKVLWAFPASVAVFGLLLMYEIYKFIHLHSFLLLVLIAIDIAFVGVIILEYWNIKKCGKNKPCDDGN